jgi:dCTP deaminase
MPRLNKREFPAMDRASPDLFHDDDLRPARSHADAPAPDRKAGFGIIPGQRIQALIDDKKIAALGGVLENQVQPASLDLRLGRTAHRIRASFLPGRSHSLRSQLPELLLHTFSLSEGAILEKGCVYLVELKENLSLPKSLSAIANPKSSTGRLDVFTRLITEFTDAFDYVEPGYQGTLYAEISPRSFSIKVREGSRLNQIRFRQLAPAHEKYRSFVLSDGELKQLHKESPLVDEEPHIRHGLHVRVSLKGSAGSQLIGYRAQQHTGIVDVDEPGKYAAREFWDPIFARPNGRLILDPREFYILASREALHIPPDYAAEMVPIDPMMGEFRVHYAGFFDPGFGHAAAGGAGSRAVLEVRSHEVPFFLEDGQIVGRLRYELLAERPKQLYGQGIGSNYQSQGLKLSKHFVVGAADFPGPEAVTAPRPAVKRSSARKARAAAPASRTSSKKPATKASRKR